MDDAMLDAVREADGGADAADAGDDLAGDDAAGFDDDSSAAEIGARVGDVAISALVGAALGAGLGWLAYRSALREPRYARPRRRGHGPSPRRAALLVEAVSEATRESAAELRQVVEETLRRELRGVIRAARRHAR
jgi:hypothetical protein